MGFGVLFRCLALAVLGFTPAVIHAAELPCYPPQRYAAPAEAPYEAEAVSVTTRDGYPLAGTLTLPKREATPLPAVLLITGSGAQTRDMMIDAEAPLSLYQPFRQIADTLSRRGIAVLRLDDRGTGCSKGSLEALTTPELADDARAALEFLRGRPDLDAGRLGLLGYDEGADIAVMIAAGGPPVRAAVLMAGSGATGLKITEFQHRHLISTGALTGEERGELAARVDKATLLARRMEKIRQQQASGQLGRWMQHYLAYDPIPNARKVTVPVLLLHGREDSQVPAEHAQILAAAMRAGGNDKVTVRVLDGLNHLFLEDPYGSFVLYAKLLQSTNQLPESLLTGIGDWLAAALAPP